MSDKSPESITMPVADLKNASVFPVLDITRRVMLIFCWLQQNDLWRRTGLVVIVSGPVRVGIAVVEADGNFLVGVRADNTVLPGMAEFPGGKCEHDEAPRACVVRECQEETGLIVLPTLHMATITHAYDHGTVELHFWHCCLANGTHHASAPHPPFQWIARELLSTLRFPVANATIVAQLLQEQTDETLQERTDGVA